MSGFDVVQHHRRRTRQAEARADMLERERAKLERLLGLALEVAAGNECKPLVLLRALEVLDRAAETGEPSAELVQLLRQTDPDRVAA